ncbi:hypothetical protein M501DRAFT_1000979 [Patellaria atrata CBS 101060]|uniref:Uncharacterized protein n=1 Tax=Patellaria atrata CBS 101060 TaxID=1346257 RepID=A0A9P4SH38_9PEZI|nr:hypothetical protein M501DRAFT_1000979 [Patellaria atrata CBS 101060]
MFIIAFQTIWLSPLIGFNRGFVILIWLSTPSFILIPAFFVDYYSDFRRYRKWIETYDENWKG